MPSGYYQRTLPSGIVRGSGVLHESRWIPVTESGCWLWLGARKAGGYGAVFFKGRYAMAHRAAWEETNGSIPEGYFLCHKCDTPSCINPSHMFLGTQLDNMRDKVSKGRANGPTRSLCGEASPKAILTAEKVACIRALLAAGELTQEQIAARYCIARTTVSSISIGKSWIDYRRNKKTGVLTPRRAA